MCSAQQHELDDPTLRARGWIVMSTAGHCCYSGGWRNDFEFVLRQNGPIGHASVAGVAGAAHSTPRYTPVGRYECDPSLFPRTNPDNV